MKLDPFKNTNKILINKINLLSIIILLFLSISINSCNQATLNPLEANDDKKKAEELYKNNTNYLINRTWQLANIPVEMQIYNIIPTLKFEENGTLIKTILVKTFLNWELSTDGKYIITKDNINKIIVDTLEIKFIDENNLIVEVINDNIINATILKYIPFNPIISKLDISGRITIFDEFTNLDFINYGEIRLVTVWDVYKDGKLSQYIWGNQAHNLNNPYDPNNLFIYKISFQQSPPNDYLNNVNYDTYFGFGKVILTNQLDLPNEGLVTNLNEDYILGGFNSKVIIFKKGDGNDLRKLWLNAFPQGYSFADYTYSNQTSNYWLNLSIFPPDLEIRREGLVIPNL